MERIDALVLRGAGLLVLLSFYIASRWKTLRRVAGVFAYAALSTIWLYSKLRD